MAGFKKRKLVTFNIDPDVWWQFLNICRSHDMSGSQVLRNHVNHIITGKLRLTDKEISEHRKAAQPDP